MAEQQQISELRPTIEKKFLKKANVVGMGIGFKETAGKRTETLALVVLVREKLPMESLASQDLVPKEVDGIATDVIRVGKVVAFQNPKERMRPVHAGASIGHYAITAGTLGAVVRDVTNNSMLLLSNNHVMANSNNAETGDTILQPGPADGGKEPQDRIADLQRFVKIQFKSGDGSGGGGSQCPFANFLSNLMNAFASLIGSKTRMVAVRAEAANMVDAAVAKPWQDSSIKDDILQIGKVHGTTAGTVGMAVKKSGRTTGLTQGAITVIDTTIDVGYGGNQVATFEHQLLSGHMSEPGDSGSLLLDSQNRAVGLLFAGSDTVTVYNPIDAVLQALNIKFA
jgi:hypothetical protein